LKPTLFFGLFCFFTLAAAVFGTGRPAFADGNCVTRFLVEMSARHTDPKRAPVLINTKMNFENTDWITETVRTVRNDYFVSAKTPSEFQSYLKNYISATRSFDQDFRSGSVSANLRNVLKKQHSVMVHGEDGTSLYQGTTRKTGTITSGRFVSETGNVISTATIDLKVGRGWNQSRMAPPVGLPGPFPEHGEIWNLWFNEIAESAKAKGLNPEDVMPKNFGFKGGVGHRYPAFFHQHLYINRMAEIMGHIENCLLRTHPSTPLNDVLVLLADYYQVGINAHLFERVNNSLLMNQMNYFLHYIGLRGISHGSLDYLALYKVPEDFRGIFIKAVIERNPGIGR